MHKGLSARRKLLLPPQEVRKHRGGTRSWEAHGTQNHTCLPERVSLLFLLLSLQQASGGVQLLAISQPVSPPRQLGGQPRLITCQETSRRLPSSLQRDLAAPSQARFPPNPAACLLFGFLPGRSCSPCNRRMFVP